MESLWTLRSNFTFALTSNFSRRVRKHKLPWIPYVPNYPASISPTLRIAGKLIIPFFFPAPPYKIHIHTLNKLIIRSSWMCGGKKTAKPRELDKINSPIFKIYKQSHVILNKVNVQFVASSRNKVWTNYENKFYWISCEAATLTYAARGCVSSIIQCVRLRSAFLYRYQQRDVGGWTAFLRQQWPLSERFPTRKK